MARLTEQDVRCLIDRLPEFEAGLLEVTGLDLCALAHRACCIEGAGSPLTAALMAAVPVSAGHGAIPYFSECVQTILEHIGCDAFVTEHADVRGLQEAVDLEADVVFLADDQRFVALNVKWGACADHDPCTANGYVAALAAAAGGLRSREVLVLGLGPVGRAASRRLREIGARVIAVEPDFERAAAGAAELGVTVVSLEDGLKRTELIFDAAPACGLVVSDWVTPGSIAAVPAAPSGFTASAQRALGSRHIHEPLAIGVAVMAVEALIGAPTVR